MCTPVADFEQLARSEYIPLRHGAILQNAWMLQQPGHSKEELLSFPEFMKVCRGYTSDGVYVPCIYLHAR